MIAEIGDHILGRAGERQVEGARLGAAHTLGGPGRSRPSVSWDPRMSSLEERVQRLEDERAVLDRLYAYCTSLDYGHRDEWLDCWTEDGVLAWPHETFTGRDEIARAFDGHSHAPEAFHKHVIVDPRVRLNGDEATAESYFTRLNDSPEGPVVRSFGRYMDVLVRCDDGAWRIRERRLDGRA